MPWKARAELEIDLDDPDEAARLRRLEPYIYTDEIETKYVVPYRLVYIDSPQPNPEEVEEGAFFEVDEIRRRLGKRRDRFTPHFRLAFKRLLGIE